MAEKMETKIDLRRIGIFLGIAFSITWLTGLAVYLTGGLVNTPPIASRAFFAKLLLAIPYTYAPAVANILTRLLTGEGWKDMGLRPHFRQGWLYWLIGWVLPALMTISGAVIFFILFPMYFDPGLTQVQQILLRIPSLASFSHWAVMVIIALAGVLLSPLVFSPATLEEEFGWRVYLLPKLLLIGWRKAMLLMGVIWGVWHYPVIFMGYEYGFHYPGYPWLGQLLFIWIAFCAGVFLAWLTLRSGSIWPAVIGHAAINGTASLAVLVATRKPNVLLGPLPVGIIGSAGFAVVALILFFSPGQKIVLPVMLNDERQQMVSGLGPPQK